MIGREVALASALFAAAAAVGAGEAVEANLARYAGETLIAGRGAGALAVGVTTLGEVRLLFGDTNAFEHREKTSVHHFANGLTIATEPARDASGVIRSISAKKENIYGGRGFGGRTDKGIALGDSREAVLEAYGDPVDVGSLKSILHYKTGITFSLRRNVVDEIVILRPRQ